MLQVLLEVVACTVVFQFVPESSNGDAGGRVPSYYDKLNSWVSVEKMFIVHCLQNGLVSRAQAVCFLDPLSCIRDLHVKGRFPVCVIVILGPSFPYHVELPDKKCGSGNWHMALSKVKFSLCAWWWYSWPVMNPTTHKMELSPWHFILFCPVCFEFNFCTRA